MNMPKKFNQKVNVNMYNNGVFSWGGKIGRSQYVINTAGIYAFSFLIGFTIGVVGTLFGYRFTGFTSSHLVILLPVVVLGFVEIFLRFNNYLKRIRDCFGDEFSINLATLVFFIPYLNILAMIVLAFLPPKEAEMVPDYILNTESQG
jgi:hypothetical protein